MGDNISIQYDVLVYTQNDSYAQKSSVPKIAALSLVSNVSILVVRNQSPLYGIQSLLYGIQSLLYGIQSWIQGDTGMTPVFTILCLLQSDSPDLMEYSFILIKTYKRKKFF